MGMRLHEIAKKVPSALGVPHETWRPNQYDMYEKAMRIDEAGGGFMFGELPTGSGKTAVATALGHHRQVLVVVHTLSLLSQYENQYGFSVVRGRQEYSCNWERKRRKWREKYGFYPLCSDCTFDPMSKCPVSEKCPYLVAKHIALNAKRAACTYRYIGVSEMMKKRYGNIVFDEAHDSAEELVRFNTMEISYDRMRKLGLPAFPITWMGEDNKGAVIGETEKSDIFTWLKKSMTRLAKAAEKDNREGARCRRAYRRFDRMSEQLFGGEWFLRIADQGVELLALDASRIARSIFKYKHTKLLMSATIGNPAPLAQSLGIDKYEFHTYPHPVPKEFRMVKDLKMPRMTKHNLQNNVDYPYLQATAIWKWIQNFPPRWRGVIVTTSYKKIVALANSLKPLAKERRLIVQYAGEKVGDVVERFITDVRAGDIMIGTIQGMGSGLDLYGDLARWIVVAGTPHENPTDEYGKARRRIFGGISYQYWVTYNAVVQACGRVSRAEQDENGNWLPNYAAIADGSATTKMAMRYFGEWFKEAII
jgi:Rad3-related DNA helicase